jgi:hypothetical protein
MVGANAGQISSARPQTPKRSFASRLFGYDIFLSFALGLPTRGTRSYASDLARRLRERDFTVFFSEEEAPPGEQLDSTLREALLRSKILVVIANRGTLEDPRWVRTEVEEFRKHHPGRAVIPINVEGALQDPVLGKNAQEWLDYEGKIWLDEVEKAIVTGIASEPVVQRLATAPTEAKAYIKWRWVVRGVVFSLAALATGLAVQTKSAIENTKSATKSAERARMELRRTVFQRLMADAQDIISGVRDEQTARAIQYLLVAKRIAPEVEVNRILLGAMFQFRGSGTKFSVSGVPVENASINPGGSHIATRGIDSSMRMWDARTGLPIGLPFNTQGRERKITSVAISPDGTRIVSGSLDHTLRLWDAKSGKPVGAPFEGHGGSVYSVAFSPDGMRIVSGGEDMTLRLWNAKTGRLLATLMGHTAAISSVAASADGRVIVSASLDRTLRLWDTSTGYPIGAPMIGHEDMVTSVAFNSDGHYIVSAGADKTLRLWDAHTGGSLGAAVQSRYADMASVAFSPDGYSIVFTSGRQHGRIVRTWDASTGKALGEFVDVDVRRVALRLDGSYIEFSGDDKTLRVSPTPSDWFDQLCNQLTGNLSRKEWNEWISPEIPYTCQCPGLPITPDDPKTATSHETCDANNKIVALPKS